MKTWNHPELGLFKFDYPSWVRDFSLPGLQAFHYDWLGGRRVRSHIRLGFTAIGDDEDEENKLLPSKQAIAVALRTIKNQQLLADRIVKAMWAELNGRGPQTPMWWHGDLCTINEQIEDAYRKSSRKSRALSSSDDLYELMGVEIVQICERTYLYEKPCVMINFAAAFDDEHGVGVLSDGSRVLGIGYQNGATPFE